MESDGYSRMIIPADIKQRTDVINAVAMANKSMRYLEIGVRNPADNFDKINVQNKTGVDIKNLGRKEVFHCSSDEFFNNHAGLMFDLIFIDGSHEYGQVKRDLENAWGALMPGGIILMHDSAPRDEGEKSLNICGDVWKVVEEEMSKPDVCGFTLDIDHGVTALRKEVEV